MNVGFASKQIFKNFIGTPMHPILADLFWHWGRKYYESVVTSAFRSGDSGVHGTLPYYRGVDLRSYIYADPAGMADDINLVWIYDYKRPKKRCVIYHNVGRGIHLHLQVSYNTKYIGGKK